MGESLLSWLEKYIWKWEGDLTKEKAKVCAEVLYLQLLRCGVTAFSDYTSVRHTGQAFRVAKRFGMRGLIGKTLMDRNSPAQLTEDRDQALADSERLIRKWHNTENGRLRFALTPRFAITCTDELLDGVIELSKKYNVAIQTHAHETKNEVAADKNLYGRSAIKQYRRMGLLGPKTILTHCVWLDKSEMDILRKTRTRVVHCPGSNMLLASGIAEIPKMLKSGILVGLGSDVAAYYNVSPFEQMRLACLIQKAIHNDPHALEKEDAFRMATSMGSAVLGFKDSGVLAKGKKADMVLLGTNRLAFSPLNDVLSQVIYSAYPSAVYESIVDGRILMRNRKVLVAREHEILKKGQEVLGS
jgi:cytosine/adenosine deaminase-related metal-dependent hydrolase